MNEALASHSIVSQITPATSILSEPCSQLLNCQGGRFCGLGPGDTSRHGELMGIPTEGSIASIAWYILSQNQCHSSPPRTYPAPCLSLTTYIHTNTSPPLTLARFPTQLHTLLPAQSQ